MKTIYEVAEMEIVKFAAEDVIATSESGTNMPAVTPEDNGDFGNVF